jgi:hypothetical protein
MYSRARLRVAEHQQKGNGSPGKTSSRLATQSPHFSDLAQGRGASVAALVPTLTLFQSVNFPRFPFITSLWNFAAHVCSSACRRHALRRQPTTECTSGVRLGVPASPCCCCEACLCLHALPCFLVRRLCPPGAHSVCGPLKTRGAVYTYIHACMHAFIHTYDTYIHTHRATAPCTTGECPAAASPTFP